LAHQDVSDRHAVIIDPASVPKQERVELLRYLDELTRQSGAAIRQVGAGVAEKKRAILIANSEGLWIEDTRHYSRLRLTAIAEQDDGPQSAVESPGVLGGYEFFQDLGISQIPVDSFSKPPSGGRMAM
jgi:TldD protein